VTMRMGPLTSDFRTLNRNLTFYERV